MATSSVTLTGRWWRGLLYLFLHDRVVAAFVFDDAGAVIAELKPAPFHTWQVRR